VSPSPLRQGTVETNNYETLNMNNIANMQSIRKESVRSYLE